MRTALTRAERQARTREELVEAADRLFTKNGFHATSVDAVADDAGYTKGAVYSNFESKEDLFFAVYERRVDRRVADTEATLASGETAYEGLERLIMGLEHGATTAGWRSSSSSGPTCCGIRSCASASRSSTGAA